MSERMLFAEEVAEIIGVARDSIKLYLYEGNKARAEGSAGPGTFPAPADKITRQVPNRTWTVTVQSNRWRAEDIADWVLARPETPLWPQERRDAVAKQLREMAA